MPNREIPETVGRLAEECVRRVSRDLKTSRVDERIGVDNIIASAIQSGIEADRQGRDDGLREALRSCLEVIDDYLAYDHDGDPWKEDARLMREMEIDDFARDGRLERARAALSAHAPASEDVVSHEPPIGDTQTGLSATDEGQGGWRWYAGYDEEYFQIGPCDNREEAIDAAKWDGLGEFKDDEGNWKQAIHLVEARKDGLRLSEWINVEGALERAVDSFHDSDRASEYDEDVFDMTKDQEADLTARIKRVCDEWQDHHRLVFPTWTFSATRNRDYVVVDREADTQPIPAKREEDTAHD